MASSGQGEELGHLGGAWSRAAAPLHGEQPLEEARASFWDACGMPARCLSVGPFRKTKDRRRRDVGSWLVWKHLGIQVQLDEVIAVPSN